MFPKRRGAYPSYLLISYGLDQYALARRSVHEVLSQLKQLFFAGCSVYHRGAVVPTEWGGYFGHARWLPSRGAVVVATLPPRFLWCWSGMPSRSCVVTGYTRDWSPSSRGVAAVALAGRSGCCRGAQRGPCSRAAVTLERCGDDPSCNLVLQGVERYALAQRSRYRVFSRLERLFT